MRAVVNKAIKEREASSNTYPFGKGGFEIGKLAEETAKRYLSPQDLELIKTRLNKILCWSYPVGCSYLCFGMSFIDEAMLTKTISIRLGQRSTSFTKGKRRKTLKMQSL